MARFLQKRNKNKGLVPGTPVFIGKKKVDEIRLRIIDYDNSKLHEDILENILDSTKYKEKNTVTWINIDGLHNTKLMKEIGEIFDLHPLLIEDIMNTDQRPKLQESENNLFIVLKMLRYDEENNAIIAEQLSLAIGKKFLLTFQEQPGDVFEPVRERIRQKKERIRATGIDYLAYALIDTVVDNYIYIIERFGEKIEDMEEVVLGNPEPYIVEQLSNYRKEMNYLRKSIRPAREAILHLSRLETDLINNKTIPFLKDLEDLITQASEAIDTYREMLSDQMNLYNSALSNKMNDVMKVLTIFAAIFIPLTFIAGIYGTNFDYFPELHFKYSYFIFWGVIVLVALLMIIFFKRKKWF